jgi:crotonobetainyl-CoA:carnitine CoA-transferase CaiB-like acyl-CoA transferase
VMVSVSGYGRTGPRAEYLAYGGNISSFSGLTYLWGQSQGTIYDYVAGAHAVVATLAAVRQREVTGVGCYIDLGQVETAGALLAPLLLDQLNGGAAAEPPRNQVAGSWFSAVVPCSGPDDWVALEAETPEDWLRLAGLLGLPELVVGGGGPPKAADADRMSEALRRWAVSRTPWQAARQLQAAGLPAAPVQSNEDVWRDPQLRARGSIVPVHHPDLGTVEYAAPVHRMTLTPARIERPAPRLGQHSRAILRSWLHLDQAEVQELVDAGVVGTADAADAADAPQGGPGEPALSVGTRAR